jgi:hypothetical protein
MPRPTSAWEREMNLSQKTISRRLKQGWSAENAILTPSAKKKKECAKNGQK